MPNDELNKKIAAILSENGNDGPTDYDKVVERLKELAEAVQSSLSPEKKIHVSIEPGFRVNMGQQYSFVTRMTEPTFRDVLFRAYVPPDGFPVQLDLLADEPPKPCRTLEELETAVITFIGDPSIKQRLLTLKLLVA